MPELSSEIITTQIQAGEKKTGPDVDRLIEELPEDVRVTFASFVEENVLASALQKLVERRRAETRKTGIEEIFEEMAKEDREDRHTPSLDEIREMDKEILLITMQNGLYDLLAGYLDIRGRLKKGEIDSEYVTHVLDLLWNARKIGRRDMPLIEKEKYDDAEEILNRDIQDPLNDKEWEDYKRLKEKKRVGKKMKRREESDLEKYSRALNIWWRSDEANVIKEKREEADRILGGYRNFRKRQEELQVTIAEEASFMTGEEFTSATYDVVMHWILNSDKRRSIGDEEMMIEVMEAVEVWREKYKGKPAIRKQVDVVQKKRLENIINHFWSFYKSIAENSGWASEPESARKPITAQFLVVTKKVADLMKETREI